MKHCEEGKSITILIFDFFIFTEDDNVQNYKKVSKHLILKAYLRTLD